MGGFLMAQAIVVRMPNIHCGYFHNGFTQLLTSNTLLNNLFPNDTNR